MNRYAAVPAGVAFAILAQLSIVDSAVADGAPPPTPATSAATPTAAQAQAPPATNGPSLPAFNDATAGMTKSSGLFSVYRGEEKSYLEIAPDQLERPFMLSISLNRGIGERNLYGGENSDPFLVQFHRSGNNLQLIKRNVRYTAQPGTPQARIVAQSYTDSILATSAIVSQPESARGSLLIDLAPIFLGDIPILGARIEQEYGQQYRLDSAGSEFASIVPRSSSLELESRLDFVVDRIPTPSPTPGAPPPPPRPVASPDPRSLVLQLHYSLTPLPNSGYKPRVADERVGYFTVLRQELNDQPNVTPDVFYVSRWQLEKAQPDKPLSPPKQPIVFWLENTVPVEYRSAVTEAILLWNQAFAKIGFKDAIVVKQQPDDADWTAGDSAHATIRWFAGRDAWFWAQGVLVADPTSGQIYDADIMVNENIVRDIRFGARQWTVPATHSPPSGFGARRSCTIEQQFVANAATGLALLRDRGEIRSAAEEDRYIHDAIVWLLVHEVGHTLGLRHNFRASMFRTAAQLGDPNERVLSASVMDYLPLNLAPRGQKQGQVYFTALGPYDEWAIEYGYKPLEGKTEAEIDAALKKIAARGAEPALAFGTDEDAPGFDGIPYDIDPRAARWDLSDDPIGCARDQFKLAHELWSDLAERPREPGASYDSVRRTFEMGWGAWETAQFNLLRYIGGIFHNREHVGDAPGRLPYEPVPAALQRAALQLTLDNSFGRESFRFPPSLLNQLSIDMQERIENQAARDRTERRDFPIHERVLRMQEATLHQIFHPLRLARIQDQALRSGDRRSAYTLAELFQTVQDSLWSELNRSNSADWEIDSLARAAQRAQLAIWIELLLQPPAGTPEDAGALARAGLIRLAERIRVALNAASAETTTRAHLEEAEARIEAALKAHSNGCTDQGSPGRSVTPGIPQLQEDLLVADRQVTGRG